MNTIETYSPKISHPASPDAAVGCCETIPLTEVLQQHWPVIRDVFKEQYLALTDDDLEYCEGREDELFERLAQKIGRPREEFEQLIWQLGVVK